MLILIPNMVVREDLSEFQRTLSHLRNVLKRKEKQSSSDKDVLYAYCDEELRKDAINLQVSPLLFLHIPTSF